MVIIKAAAKVIQARLLIAEWTELIPRMTFLLLFFHWEEFAAIAIFMLSMAVRSEHSNLVMDWELESSCNELGMVAQ